jgi:formate dehydrogenase subunit gamma
MDRRIPMHALKTWQHFFAALLLCLLLPLTLSVAHAAVPNEKAKPAYAEEQTILQAEKDTPQPGRGSPDSGRRHIDRHYVKPFGLQPEMDVILQRGGNTWRSLRNGPLSTMAGILLLVVPLLIFGFYQAVGPARLDRPESGRRIQRFTLWDRVIHWATAISFLALALTGLVILFGKKLLIPLVGHDAFSWLAIISKNIHNFVGPLFIACSVLLFLTFVRENLFRRWDWNWIRKGGGLVTHKHVPAGYFNAGEKIWFWGGVALLGIIVSISGLLLDFVNFRQTRYILQWANYLHMGGAVLYMAASMGHIFIGTWGTPGAYDAMRHGTVDEEWARTHHALWYEDVKEGRVSAPRGRVADNVRPTPPVEPRRGSDYA